MRKRLLVLPVFAALIFAPMPIETADAGWLSRMLSKRYQNWVPPKTRPRAERRVRTRTFTRQRKRNSAAGRAADFYGDQVTGEALKRGGEALIGIDDDPKYQRTLPRRTLPPYRSRSGWRR